jgi:hypothetical protein
LVGTKVRALLCELGKTFADEHIDICRLPEESKLPEKENDDNLDDVDMVDLEADVNSEAEVNPEADLKALLADPDAKEKEKARSDFFKTLGAYKQSSFSTTDDAHTSNTRNFTHLSAQESKALEGLRQNLEVDVAALPFEDRDSICALCQEPVTPTLSTRFYRDRKRTVKNQTLFCKEHKRITAQTEYTTLGLPQIDWGELPSRIRRYKPQLVKLLRNETEGESEYRKQHAAKLLTGKAAALPSRAKDKKKEVLEEEAFKTIDTTEEPTGYYGPRGKRIMMEVIGAELVEHIGHAMATDPVVGRSGFAAFLQAVLVPELTILLVMEDLGGVSKGVAKEKIRKSGELGLLLHEDVDDEVVALSDEELSDLEDDS